MIKIKNKKNCCGCHSCESICPKGAITMVADKDGFLYPKVDMNRCVKCGLCLKACPIINKQTSENTPKIYAGVNKDENIRRTSSSGGIFFLIAQKVVENGGVVFGAVFDETFTVCHKVAKTIDEVKKMCGSKYVQSKIGNSYKEAKDFLDKGTTVFFTGTPCQIGGLYSYLGKQYDNLLTADIICHGVPSPKVWQAFLKDRQKKYKSKVKSAEFRNKIYGWNKFSMHLEFENGEEYLKQEHKDEYMRLFLWDISLRPSCFKCNFKGESRQSDITMADFWGVEIYIKDFCDDKGTSLIWLNSEKGERMFEEISENITYVKSNMPNCLKSNVYAIKSVSWMKKKNPRKRFFAELDKADFDELADKYVRETNIKKKLRKVYYKMKKLLK